MYLLRNVIASLVVSSTWTPSILPLVFHCCSLVMWPGMGFCNSGNFIQLTYKEDLGPTPCPSTDVFSDLRVLTHSINCKKNTFCQRSGVGENHHVKCMVHNLHKYLHQLCTIPLHIYMYALHTIPNWPLCTSFQHGSSGFFTADD